MRAEILMVCVLAPMLLVGCVPRLYQRETLRLDHGEIERFDIRYADFEGCLLRRAVPVAYKLKRPSYTLTLDIHFGQDDRAPGIDLGLSGGESLSASFSGLAPEPIATIEGGKAHYRVEAGSIRGASFAVQVLMSGRPAGEEIILVQRKHCRALALDHDR
ncbi:MAG: hypothetical protein ACT4QA_02950 [Panacagrimonas sp.]